MPIGPMELFIIFLIVVVLFGARRLPQIGRGLGEGIRNFKTGVKGEDSPDRLKESEGSSRSAS